MKLEIQKIGEAYGVILPTEVLDALKVQAGDVLRLTRNDQGFQMTVASAEFEAQMAVARKLIARYGATLRELAR